MAKVRYAVELGEKRARIPAHNARPGTFDKSTQVSVPEYRLVVYSEPHWNIGRKVATFATEDDAMEFQRWLNELPGATELEHR